MKMKIFITIFVVLILIANISFASYSTVTMTVVEEPVCTIEMGENSKFEKKLISKDLNNKEVTLQLQITNEEISTKPTGEVVLVIDNSSSMTQDASNGKTRKDLVFNSTKTLISNLLKDNDDLKIGIVQFSTNTDVQKEGTAEDAKLVHGLTNDATALNNAISNIDTNGPRTDLQSGLLLGKEQFTEADNNKYIIILTDGIPNVAVEYDKQYYSDDVISKTKTELEQLGKNNINVITMLTGISNPDDKPNSYVTEKTNAQIISEVFGTTKNPTVGKFYYVTDDKVESTITNDIYNSLLPINKSFKNIKVVDYFPQYIIDNFDFAYVSESNIGNISAEVNKEDNSITWTIPELEVGKTATVQYKLKLKQNFDSKIVGDILDTNEKVDISYNDFDEKIQNKTSNITPKLKLAEPPSILPKTGITPLIITLSSLVAIVLVFSFVKLVVINKKTK